MMPSVFAWNSLIVETAVNSVISPNSGLSTTLRRSMRSCDASWASGSGAANRDVPSTAGGAAAFECDWRNRALNRRLPVLCGSSRRLRATVTASVERAMLTHRARFASTRAVIGSRVLSSATVQYLVTSVIDNPPKGSTICSHVGAPAAVAL